MVDFAWVRLKNWFKRTFLVNYRILAVANTYKQSLALSSLRGFLAIAKSHKTQKSSIFHGLSILAVSLLREFLKCDKSNKTQYHRILALGEITKSFKFQKASKPEKVLYIRVCLFKGIPQN